jgi:hypothetical protein
MIVKTVMKALGANLVGTRLSVHGSLDNVVQIKPVLKIAPI